MTVHNLSPNSASQVQVGACLGDVNSGPCATVLTTLSEIPANGASVATLTLAGLTVNAPQVSVLVDPNALLDDPNRGNNYAFTNVNVVAPAYDFSISSFSGGPQSYPIQSGTAVSLTAYLVNAGSQAANVPYSLYLGSPEEGGTVVAHGAVELPAVGPSLVAGTLQLSTTATGARTLFVLVLDPAGTLSNENPATARASFTIGSPTDTTDLGLSYNDISFNPVGPNIGETTQVQTVVHDFGSVAGTALLTAFEGDPAIGGKALGNFPISVQAGQTQTVSFPWTRTAAQTNLFFVLSEIVPTDTVSANNEAQRNAFVEAIYDSGRRFYNETLSAPPTNTEQPPYISAPAVGDIFRTGQPVIAYGDSASPLQSQAGLGEAEVGDLTLIQKLPDNSIQEVWTATIGNSVGAPVFASLLPDGGPEIIFISEDGFYSTGSYNFSNTVHVWNPDGGVVWEQTYYSAVPSAAEICEYDYNQIAPGIGDVNGDGIADVVFPTPAGAGLPGIVLHALDGRTGAPIWETTIPNATCGGQLLDPPASILDLAGNGANEVIYQGEIVSSTGVLLNTAFTPSGNDLFFGLAALSGPGGADVVSINYGSSGVTTFDPMTGTQVWIQQSNPLEDGQTSESPYAIADGRQNGQPLFTDGIYEGMEAVGPDGTIQWSAQGNPSQGVPPSVNVGAIDEAVAANIAAADLLGLGRPQFIANGLLDQLTMFDSRDGSVLFAPGVLQFSIVLSEAVADVDGDGHGEVVMSNGTATEVAGVPSVFSYQGASLVIYGSDAHWQKMPTVWSGLDYHHQYNENLTLTADAYAPWTTHNTWREQFVDTPVTLLADLAVSPSDIVASPAQPAAGASTTVTVTVHNVGGLTASNFPVALYVGNPDGGQLIGTQNIAGPVAIQGGTATASFTWDAWPEGEDTLTAVANPEQADGGYAVQESGYENNTASAAVYVGQGTNLADLEVATSDIVFTPANPVGGQAVSVAVTVHNLGAVAAGAFQVLISDGTPPNGYVVGTPSIAALGAGASTTVTVNGWYPGEGTHTVVVVADPLHVVPVSNVGGETAVATLVVGLTGQPDLVVAPKDLVLTPASPVPSGTASVGLVATIHNYGSPVSNIPLAVYLDQGQPSQQLLISSVITGTLNTGATVPLSGAIPTTGLTGSHTVTVVIDPNDTIQESSRANNQATVPLVFQPAPALVTVTTDQPSYPANSPVSVTVTMASQVAVDATYTLSAAIQTASGVPVATVASGWSLPLGSGVVQTLPPFVWNDGTTQPGNYLAVATLTGANGKPVASGQAAFTIVPTESVRLTTGPMLSAYQPGSTAVISTLIENTSVNTVLNDVSLAVTVLTPASQSFYSSTRHGLTVALGGTAKEMDAVVLAVSSVPGNYPITAVLTDSGGHQLATASGTLVVQTATVSTGLVGSITAMPGTFAIGQTVTLTASATDVASTPFLNQPFSVEVGDPSTQTVLASFNSVQSLQPGQNVTLTEQYGTTGLTPGDYLAALIVNGTPIAHTVLHAETQVTAPPSIVITGVSDGEVTNQTVTPQVSVTDATTFTETVTLNGQSYTPGTPIAAAGSYTLVASATDAYGNSASVTVRFTIYLTPPSIVITGVTNGEITNAASVTPVITITDPYLDPTKTVIERSTASRSSQGRP